MKQLLAALAVLCLLARTATASAPPPPAPAFVLNTLDGKRWHSREQPSQAIVIVFLSTECPMVGTYIEQLNGLARLCQERGAQLVGIYASPDASLASLREHARDYRIAFPLLRDQRQVAVAALGARVTPEAFVLDSLGVVRYRGRIDDGFSARLKPRARVSRRDLAQAIDEVLAGKAVRVPETQAHGCPLPGTQRKLEPRAITVTYHRDVLPILQARCQSCHRPGQVGPFALETCADAVRWAEDIVGETRSGRMPPWKPAQHGTFTNERSLKPGELAILQAWLDQGTPEGDPREAPPRRTFPEGWQLGTPDLVLEMPSEAVVAATGRDLFHVVVLPTNLPEDRYIAAVEVRPGNPRVVHHTINLVDTRGQARKLVAQAQARAKPTDPDRGPGYSTRMGFGFLPNPSRGLGGWAPGLVPQRLPAGVGQLLPRGADIVMQVHYHRTGKEERDRTRIGLYFQKGPVTTHFQAMPVPGLFLRIPPGEQDFRVQNSVTLTEEATLYYLVPHMHKLGKKIQLSVQVPGGREETLINIDDWDYNWQEMYQLKTPRKLPKGTVLRVRATFDNSSNNPMNPSSPPKWVRFGEQTTNEMCFVFCGVSTVTPGFPKFRLNLGG